MGGTPKFVESQTLPDVDYAAFAASLGLQAHHGRPTPTSSGRPGTRRWPRTGRPCSTCTCDPDVPPIPPHATFEQMKDAAEALIKGDDEPLGRDQGGHQDQGPGVPAAPDATAEADRLMLDAAVDLDVDVAAYTVPTDAPEADGTLSLGLHHHGAGRPRRPATPTGTGWTYGPPACATVDPRPARRRRRSGATRWTSAAASTRWSRAVRNAGRPGVVGIRHLRGRHRAVGPQGAPARPAAAPPARRRPRRGPGLRQRRLHHLRRRRSCATQLTRLGDRAAASRASRSRSASRGAPSPRATCDRIASGPRSRSATAPSCSSTPTAATPRKQAIRVMAAADDLDVALVRGAGLLRRPRRAARGPRRASPPTSPPASTATTCPTSAACAPPAPSTACRSTSPGAAASPSGCASPPSPRRSASRSPGTARPTCTPTPPRRSPTCATWSGSTTTSGSSRCSSTAPSTRSAARSPRIRSAPGHGLTLREADVAGYRSGGLTRRSSSRPRRRRFSTRTSSSPTEPISMPRLPSTNSQIASV